MADRIQIHGVAVNDKLYPVFMTENGTFETEVDGAKLAATNRDDLVDTIKQAVRKSRAKIAVPFTKLLHYNVVRGTVTGIHGGNGKIKVTWEGGGSEQVNGYDLRHAMNPLTDEQVDQLKALVKAEKVASSALSDFLCTHRMQLLDEVRKAVGHALPEDKAQSEAHDEAR